MAAGESVMRAAVAGLALLLGTSFSGMVQAAESLSSSGVRLADETVDLSTSVTLSRTISVGGDSPGATYVTANLADGRRLQRNNLGYWLPWDGRASTLIDNRFAASGGNVTYKILSQDISDLFFPISITLAYRVDGTIKYGVFTVMPVQ